MFLITVGLLSLWAPLTYGLTLQQAHTRKSARPNIVLILADDLHREVDMLQRLPNILEMKKNGVEFPNHISTSPVCAPSRASLLTGLYPHNHGFLSDQHPDAVNNFMPLQHKSVGQWLTKAGYYTAFLGKYVNSLNHMKVPRGWRHYGGFEGHGTYTYYNATQWQVDFDETGIVNTTPQVLRRWTDVHQADFLADQTIEQAQKAVAFGMPFFIFTNPAMVHLGPCYGPWEVLDNASPCPKKRDTNFLENRVGTWRLHTPNPAFNKGVSGLAFPRTPSCCSSKQQEVSLPHVRETRTSSALDLDEMVGTIVDGLRSMKVLDNTFVIFTSDNGFHAGEHQFATGKKLPYQTDIRVTMVVRVPDGSSLQRGVSRSLPTSHLDITRTIVDLAGAEAFVSPALEKLDGQSFADALGDKNMMWRRYSYSEMFESKGRTWRAIQYTNQAGEVEWTFHVWCTGETEIFQMDQDPYQMRNSLDPNNSTVVAQNIMSEWLPVIYGMGTCSGSSCNEKLSKPLDKKVQDFMECANYGSAE